MRRSSLVWQLAAAAALLMLLLFSSQLSRPAPVTHADPRGADSIVTPRPRMVSGRVAFIGDSYTVGAGGGGQRWSTLLAAEHGWDEINLGIGGSGYVPQSYGDPYKLDCSKRHCLSYLDEAKNMGDRRVEMIFVSGGRNDVRATSETVDKYSRQLFETLRKQAPQAKVYVLSPFWGSSDYPDWLANHAKVLEANAKHAGFTYLEIGHPLESRPELMDKDQVHPAGPGYQLLASAIDAQYREAVK